MPLLREESEKLSNNQLVAGVVDEIIERDDLFAVLPFTGVNGKAYVYDREETLSEGEFLDPNEPVPEGAATFTEHIAKLRILAGDVDVDKFLQTTMSDTNNQMAIQVAKKAKGLARKFHRTLAQGNATTNPKEFDGLPRLVSADQSIAAGVDGNALTLTMMDELCDAVPNGADVIVMRRGTIRAYRNLLRLQNGNDGAIQQLENFGRPMLTHNGIPIIMNEFLLGNEVQGANANTCSVYAMRLNEADGLHGLFGGDTAGIVVENLGTVQNKDAWRIRLKWYVSMALKSTKSLARIRGVTNI